MSSFWLEKGFELPSPWYSVLLGLKEEGRPKMLTSLNREKTKEREEEGIQTAFSAWIFGPEDRLSSHSHAPVLVPAHFTQKSALPAIPLHVPAPGGDRLPVRICTMGGLRKESLV